MREDFCGDIEMRKGIPMGNLTMPYAVLSFWEMQWPLLHCDEGGKREWLGSTELKWIRMVVDDERDSLRDIITLTQAYLMSYDFFACGPSSWIGDIVGKDDGLSHTLVVLASPDLLREVW